MSAAGNALGAFCATEESALPSPADASLSSVVGLAGPEAIKKLLADTPVLVCDASAWVKVYKHTKDPSQGWSLIVEVASQSPNTTGANTPCIPHSTPPPPTNTAQGQLDEGAKDFQHTVLRKSPIPPDTHVLIFLS